jgi:hypothetical protein
MRFTIRDLLWLTVVVALGLCWWRDHISQRKCLDALRYNAARLKPLNVDIYESLGQTGVIRLRRIPHGCGN